MASDVAIDLFAGTMSGVAECLVCQPLDMLKTRLQLTTGAAGFRAVGHAILKEGGVWQFYRGLLPPLMGMAPKNAVWMASNEAFRDGLLRWHGLTEPTSALVFAAGFMSGALEATVVTPFESVKVRMQAQTFNAVYRNSAHCLWHMLRDEGVRSVFRGLEVCMLRNGVWTSHYFLFIHRIRTHFAAQTPAAAPPSPFLTGLGAGALAVVFNNPLDVAKSRIQSQPFHRRKYVWSLQALGVIAREEGLGAWYRGFAAKCLRMGLGGGVVLLTFDTVKALWRH